MAGQLSLPAGPAAALLEGTAGDLDLVAAELRRWAAEPFDRRRANCGLSALAYVERVTGRRLRPSPRMLSPIVMASLWLRPGSLETFADWAMGRLGCPPTETPIAGDVGLADFGLGPTACLCTGRFWAARGEDGAVFKIVEPARAWSVRSRTESTARKEAPCRRR